MVEWVSNFTHRLRGAFDRKETCKTKDSSAQVRMYIRRVKQAYVVMVLI